MKQIFTTIIAALVCIAASAQTTVKGVVLDSQTREGECFATLQFFNSADLSKAIAYTMTAEDGSFEYGLAGTGEYVMLFSNLGRLDVRVPFTLSGSEEICDLGSILVEDDAETLDAASVVAQKNLVKMEVDKITYKVEDDVDAQASTVLDMLRKVPMVSVDGQDNITVNGSSSFQVYVDGKPNQMMSANPSQVFKVLPASMVKSIDVVTNPGVKQDAEGAGGILNITTNTVATGGQSIAEGQYGTVTAQASSRGFGGSVYYSMQKDKFSLSLNGSVNSMSNDGTSTTIERIQDTPAGQMSTLTTTESDMKSPMKMGSVSANYEIDSENILSATASIMSFNSTSDGLTSTLITYPDATTTGYDGISNTEMSHNSINASLDYQHSWNDTPGRSLVLSYQFTGTPSVNNTLNTFGGSAISGLDLTDRKADGKSNSLSHILQADFTTPLAKGQSLSFGSKLIYRDNSSDQTNFIWNGTSFEPTAAGSLNYDYTNKIGSAYAEYAGQFGLFGVKAGLRYEYTWQDVTYTSGQGSDFSLSYGNLVPALSLQYNLSQTSNLGLSYNMRISRPGITYLNPYVDTSDPLSLTYGNTSLSTENTHNVSLVYNLFTPKFITNITLRGSLTDGGISQYSFFDANNILNTTYGNIVRNITTGLNGYAMWMPTNKTRIIVNGAISYTDLQSEALAQSNSGWSHNLMLGIQQTLPLDLRLSANIINAGSSVSLQGTSTGINMVMGGISKSFLDGKLNVSVNANASLKDGFKMKIEQTTTGEGFENRMSTTVPMGQVSASISYSFGKQGNYGSKKVNRRASDDSELNSTSLTESLGTMMM